MWNPTSFHNPFVRMLRQWAMSPTVESLWSPYVTKHQIINQVARPAESWHRQWALVSTTESLWLPYVTEYQIIDHRMMYPCPRPAESWHRDEIVQEWRGSGSESQFQETFGGCIKLDDTCQYFNCVKGAYSTMNTTSKGFTSIKRTQEKKRCIYNIIPPTTDTLQASRIRNVPWFITAQS